MEIDFEQVVAGALLRFGVVDNFTLLFIVDKLQQNLAVNYTVGQIGEIRSVASDCPGGFTLNFSEGAEWTYHKLQELAGSYVTNFVNDLDLKELVMKKVEDYEKHHLPMFFSPLEEEMVDKLHSEGYLATWHDDNNNEEVVLTNLGAAYLYMLNNEGIVNGLKAEIKAFGVRDDLLELYFAYKKNKDNWSKYESVRYREFTLWYENMMGEARI